jgi:hypothetical protein
MVVPSCGRVMNEAPFHDHVARLNDGWSRGKESKKATNAQRHCTPGISSSSLHQKG